LVFDQKCNYSAVHGYGAKGQSFTGPRMEERFWILTPARLDRDDMAKYVK